MKPLNNIKNLYPLLQINSFPFLEKTFDDMDEYVILARIQRAINEVITNNNTLNDNFTELNNYVTDYFKNLDVQDEVDKKLQEMANDGTLADIINNNLLKNINDNIESLNETTAENTKNINKTTNDFNTFKTETNTTLNNINNKVNSVASGAPIPVNSISEMTDTSKSYVLTTDGKWYYYNGSSWVAGGVYQATGLSDNQVKSKNIESLEFEKIGLTDLGINVDNFWGWNSKGNIIKNDNGSITYNKTISGNGGIGLSIPIQNKDVYLIIDVSSNYNGVTPYYLYIDKPSTSRLFTITEGINIYKIDKQYTNINNSVLISNSLITNITINNIIVLSGNILEKFADKNLSEIINNYNNFTNYSDIKNYKPYNINNFLIWNSLPYLKLKNKNSFIMKGRTDNNNSGIQTQEFTQTSGYLYLKGKLTIPNNSQVDVFIHKIDANNNLIISSFNSNDTEFNIKIDLSYYAVYNNLKNYYVYITVNGGYPGNEVEIDNFELFFGNIEDLNIYADNLNDIILNIQNNLDTLNGKIENITSPSNILIAPDGKKYQIAVNNEGNLYTFPITPTKALYIGNSLLLGFGTHGMASYDINSDYYHYVNEEILKVNPSYTSTKISGTDFEGAENIEDVNTFITSKLNPALESDMNLIIIQLGDNNNTETKINLLPQSAPLLIQAIKTKCPNAKIFWVGCWYSTSQKLQYIQKTCIDNNIQFINISALNTKENQAKIGDQYIDGEGQIQTITQDGVASHPSSTGMLAIANTIIPYLDL